MGEAKEWIHRRTKKRNKARPFAAIEILTLNSEAWRWLTQTEAHVYNVLKTFYRGNDEWFKAPFSLLKDRCRIKHGQTINRALMGLETKNWIEIRRFGKLGRCRGLRVRANEYKITWRSDYRRW